MSDADRAVAEEKAELRRRLRERLDDHRGATDAGRRREAGERLGGHLLALPELARPRRVLACLSFGAEIDTWGVVERLGAAGHQVAVPRSVGGAEPRLSAHAWPCELETLSFGLRQPTADAPEVPPGELDLALLLGLGFDRAGFRLGYGRGHFDRFLGAHRIPAIGLAWHFQLVDRLPVEPHDVPVELLVTEEGVHRV